MKAEVGQSVWIADFWSLIDSVVGKTLENGAAIVGIPNFINFVVFAFVSTFFAFSSHTTFTLDKGWSGSVFTKRIVQWVTEFWSALTFILITTFINRFRNWFIKDWARWNLRSGAIITLDLDNLPELTTLRASVFDNFVSFFVEFGWFWSTELSSVSTSG